AHRQAAGRQPRCVQRLPAGQFLSRAQHRGRRPYRDRALPGRDPHRPAVRERACRDVDHLDDDGGRVPGRSRDAAGVRQRARFGADGAVARSGPGRGASRARRVAGVGGLRLERRGSGVPPRAATGAQQQRSDELAGRAVGVAGPCRPRGGIDAQRAIEKAIALQPNGASFHQTLAVIAIQRGDAKAALHAAQQGPAGSWKELALAMARQIGGDQAAADASLQGVIAKYGEGNAYQVAEIYALRKQPQPMFEWLERAWVNRDPGVSYLLYDPFLAPYRNDPRFAAFCKKVGLPPPSRPA